MTSPAERYQASQRRGEYPALTEFLGGLDFDLDDFQIEACRAVERGTGVLVCAPTGAGKTVVGEFAVHMALRQGRKCFYTTPIKALSNQKYNDLVSVHGADKVGLLTGDNAINGDAPVVVMTTEVLRNMLYARSATLESLAFVVMDEVHYLADRFRGAVWEEVIIHLPESVALVSLSATVSNAEEFADWLVTVRGETKIVVSEVRPVPLWQHMLVGKRMFDLFHDQEAATKHEVHPELLRHTRELLRRIGWDDRGRRGRGGHHLVSPRVEVIERLDRENLLPAIIFIFSRAGCDAAVQQCLNSGLRLTSPDERREIRELVESRTAQIPSEDLNVLGYWSWLEGLERGLAAHHAGMLPAFKEVVEELFLRGLVRAVFATETLALGINMPARSVVLEKLVKFNGEAHVDLTAGEYTQLTGRAGRRGIDVEGHAVVVWTPESDPRHVAGLASTRTYPLKSSFRPSYNMAVNLVATVGPARARDLLESSFAQFQADRSVVGIARQVVRNDEAVGAMDTELECHLGDFAEYFALRVAIADRERAVQKETAASRRAAAAASVAKLRIGDVIKVPTGRRAGLAVVLDPGIDGFGEPKPLILSADGWAGRIAAADFSSPVEALAHLRIPKHFNHRAPGDRKGLVSSMKATDLEPGRRSARRDRAGAKDDQRIEELRRQLRRHPCHACPEREDHARWAERRERLWRETEALRDKVANRTGSLARTFDQVCGLLTDRGYLTAAGEITPQGRTLSRIWAETDLLVAECLRRGVWDGLDPAELAAAASIMVYEARRDTEDRASVPRGPVTEAVEDTLRIWSEVETDEASRGLQLTREPDLGFVWPVYRWARGEALPKVLASVHGLDTEMPAGDFVRWCRQVIDLLGQIAGADGTPAELKAVARQAIDDLRRGVLAYSSVG